MKTSESFDLKYTNHIEAVPTNNFDVCEKSSPEHCGKDSDLELPTNHLAENKREIENTETTVKRRSFWEKPCDLSITFENLDTPMREVYNNMDMEERKKHRRSFWEKPDESKLTPVTLKGINNSGNVSDHDELTSPMHENIQKNMSSVEHSYQESNLVDSVEKNTSFPTTPYHLLPKTPNPDNSRRSTHVVEKPKIFKLDEVQKKKLFADEADVSIDQVEINICCDENIVTRSSIVPLKNQNKEPKEEQKKEDVDNEIMTKETATLENKFINNLDNPQDTNNSMQLKDSCINPSVNENENKNPNGLFFISCSSTKPVDKQVKSTVAKSISRKQPNKPVTTTSQKKVSPKRPLSQARMSENKRRKTNETTEQNDEIRNNKNTERSKQSTVNKQPSLKGSSAVQGRVKAPAKGVAQSKLLLMKKTKTVDAGSLCVDNNRNNVKLAPTREVLSFRAYSQHRRLNQLRRAACLKQAILDMLLSFNPLWLRIGLETTFGEMIMIQNNGDVIGLSRFIITRVLGNPDIACEFSHPSVPHLRVMEILSEDHTLTKKLRAPAISRLQKIHNMDVVFQILAKQGVNVDLKGAKVTCRDVVDGHREKTLKLLWCLIVQYQVSLLLNKEQLKEEIRILERSLMVRNQLAALQRYEEFLSQKKRDSIDPDLFSQNELVMLLLKWCRVVSAYYGIQKLKKINKTITWCKTDKFLENNSAQWTCLMSPDTPLSSITLAKEIIKHQTMRTLTEDNDHANNQNNSLSDSFGQAPFTVKEDDALFEQMLSNEKENFKTLYEKVSELGGIPLMLRSADMSNTIPDEKVVVTYVTYLCARLLDIRHESRAARVIQLAWRRHHLQKVKKDFVIKQRAAIVIQRERYMLAQRDRSQFQLKVKASITIQSTVRSYLHQQRYRNIIKSIRTIQSKYSAYKLQQKCRSEYVEKKMAAITIQSVVRMITARKNFKREKAALKIQTTWRMYTCKNLLKTHLSSVVKIQTYYRMVCQKRKFKQLKKSAVTLQRYFSTYLLMRKDRETYHKQLQSCLKIQRWWKSLIESKKAKHIAAAIKIQAAFRGFVQKKIYVKTRRHVIRLQASARRCLASTQYKKQKQAVLKIQEWYRRHLLLVKCQKEFRQKKQAVVYLQSCIRRWRCMKEYQNMKTSVIKIQSSVRTFLAVTSFKKKKKAVAVIQKHHHAWSVMKIEKRKYDKIKQACVVIQSYWRGRKVRQTLVKMNKAAVIIQTKFRGQIARDYYLCLKEFVIVCQRRLRAKLQKRTEREEIIRQTKAATVIQTRFRGFIEKQRFRRSIHSIVKLQTNIRGYLQRKRFLQLKHSTLLLQRHYRAYKECKNVRTMYLVKKGAAITIQGYFRGFMVRKMVKKLNVSAIKVQSVYRGYKQKQCYLSMRKAAKTCQALYRAKITGMKERYKYLMIKISALVIQRHYRSYKISKVERERHQAALKIQTLYRSHRGRTQYLKLKQNVIKCQQLYRNKTMARFCRRQYLCTKTAVVTIQAIFRGWKIRRLLFRQHKAATVIQSAYRRYVLHNKFNHLKQATLTVQRIYRAHVLGSYTRTEFLIKKGAAMTLQAAYKGWKVRKGIVQQHQKAKTIQSAFRGYIQQKNYQRLKKAAVLCQKVYRTHVLGSYARKEFINLKNAIIFIQARYRGLKVRQEMRMKNEAATKIQSVYRGYIQYGQFTSLKKAVLSCQKIYRNHRIGAKHRKAFLLTKVLQLHYKLLSEDGRNHRIGAKHRKAFLLTKGATITLQAFIRGWKVRQEMRMKNEAATKIQSVYRGYIQYGQFTSLKEAVISCQKIYRNCIKGARMRKEFLLTKGAIITLQAFIRGWKVRRNVKRQCQAAVVIQSAYRRHIEHNKFTKLKKATVACQKRYRASILSKQIRRQFLIQKGAALIIEDWYCAYLERCKEKQRHNRATVIQKVYRGYRVRNKYRKVKDAVATIQRHYKNYRTTRQMRNQYLSMQVSAVIIQKYCRGYQNSECCEKLSATKRFIKLKSAALICQKRFRAAIFGHQQRLAFLKVRSAAVLIQSHARRWLAQRSFITQLSHIVTIQKSFRGYLARKNFQLLKKAVCIIQNRWRVVMEMHKIQRDNLIKQGAAITIQSSWKAYLARKEYKKLCCLTIKLQALVRSKQQRRKYKDLKSSAFTIQRHFRACLIGKNIKMEYIKTKATVVKLQAFIRGNQARMLLKRMKACITIQSHYKGYVCVKNYQRIRRAVITIQSQYRGMLERRQFQKKVEAVVKIQKCVKRRSFANRVRNYLEERRKSAILIQAWYRGYQGRKIVHRLKAVIKIQALVRMKLQRLEYKSRIKSVIVVQSCVRRYLVQKEAGKLRKEIRAVICIQKAYRKFKERQHIKLQKKARQAYVRKFTKMLWLNLAAITVQRFYRKCKLMEQAKEKLCKILIIQRWSKGRLCRLRYLKLQRSIVVLQRKARLHLKTRQEAAVKIQTAIRKWLQIKKQKLKIKAIVKIQSIWRGEQVRRRSIGQKIEKIRKRVEKANRSATEENKLGNRMASALDYLLRYKQLSHILEVLIHLDVATRLSAACCEKFVSVNAVHVIYRLMRGCNRSQPHMELIKYSVSILLNLAKEIHQDKKLAEKIRSIHLLTARKHKIDESRQLRQARLLAAKSFNCSLPIHHKKQHKIKPDWVLRKDKMKELQDPLSAVNFVMDSFQLKSK
ncbi:ASP [Mytilus edulis]|uniref:ASPM n=1 Tax=Mytilus edulis TaxID=6550 RepID=A0A8S3R407_MYTED|nr:ASP [Mytilus edulis]